MSDCLTTRTLAERWCPPHDSESAEKRDKRVRARMITLARWRTNGVGPKFMKIGKQVLYKREDVEAYEESNTHGSTAEY